MSKLKRLVIWADPAAVEAGYLHLREIERRGGNDDVAAAVEVLRQVVYGATPSAPRKAAQGTAATPPVHLLPSRDDYLLTHLGRTACGVAIVGRFRPSGFAGVSEVETTHGVVCVTEDPDLLSCRRCKGAKPVGAP